MVSLSTVPILTAGDHHIITCTATVDDYLVVVPTLQWIFPENASSLSTGTQSTSGSTSNITLTFNEVRTSQGGIYGCSAIINTTGFDLLNQTVNQTIQILSE